VPFTEQEQDHSLRFNAENTAGIHAENPGGLGNVRALVAKNATTAASVDHNGMHVMRILHLPKI
jgi:hypothetical protein